MKHRRAEIEYLSGDVPEKGKDASVKTAFCVKKAETVPGHGVGKLEPKTENLRPLEVLLP